ncbi:unnamed protein product [Oppiella nova]|uniref:Uncharacterized protein n=1 Tax=Oppiella nova TaxID=334625 RepID=A0A7R9QL12_9ACAR|nr:unnamed protein product [Oppiella nova]CAG2167109.1 unnamed protein product [Oppiella nova]
MPGFHKKRVIGVCDEEFDEYTCGFDRNRVVGVSDEDLQEFSCGICLEIFVDPMSMLGVIGRARHHLNKYHIESKFWSIAEAGYDLRTSISVSIDAILNNNSYKDISTYIINALNGCEEGKGCWSKRWNCVVLSRSGGESDICAVDDYFRVSFGDLFIVIFSVQN